MRYGNSRANEIGHRTKAINPVFDLIRFNIDRDHDSILTLSLKFRVKNRWRSDMICWMSNTAKNFCCTANRYAFFIFHVTRFPYSYEKIIVTKNSHETALFVPKLTALLALVRGLSLTSSLSSDLT